MSRESDNLNGFSCTTTCEDASCQRHVISIRSSPTNHIIFTLMTCTLKFLRGASFIRAKNCTGHATISQRFYTDCFNVSDWSMNSFSTKRLLTIDVNLFFIYN